MAEREAKASVPELQHAALKMSLKEILTNRADSPGDLYALSSVVGHLVDQRPDGAAHKLH
jgi:hypothetical protein